jgi:tRNA pseudouridine38-40 synthase
MVRRMAGLLVEVGRGKLSAAKVADYLEGTAGNTAEFTAPAFGLFFEKAFYNKDELNKFLILSGQERPS